MRREWTFGRKIAIGLTIKALLTIIMAIVALVTLQSVVTSKDKVINVDGPLMVRATQLQTVRQQLVSGFRNYLLSGVQDDLDALQDTRKTFADTLADLKADAATEQGAKLVDAISAQYDNYNKATDTIAQLRQNGTDIATALAAYKDQVTPIGTTLSAAITDYVTFRQNELNASQDASTKVAQQAEMWIGGIAVAAVLLALFVAVYLTRSLTRQIGAAVGHVQSSSAELQSAANQQASGMKEQTISMNEIATTISELLATSRQIAESSQRVAQIAEQTATSARSGDSTVDTAQMSIEGIRRQVDQIVNHMVDLGKKSQQIGAVLDIVAELAEQTNILSINATIEAAGAGENGKRFAIVADEIRKLADRVGSSAKEVRSLIDDVRSSVNTTVMATETGSKAVETGSRQFGDVASAFKAIADLVATTTEAAREIELSTKQQATAVEQVNLAIANVTQAARETEASTSQTLETASLLASTSGELLRLVQAKAAA
ncbi:MAG TPA: methyl-accepting chemotaxis protein [Bauldia sp.]|nr:methyl-accepting chemotaxis protein [Bauldia sp.]